MIEVYKKHHYDLMQCIEFINKHQPAFLRDFANVYKSNKHLLPFFKDIKAFADNLETPEIIIIQKGENLFISANENCDEYDNVLKEFMQKCFEKSNALWLNLSSEGLKPKINILFEKHNPENLVRYNFRLKEQAYSKLQNWRDKIPPGFSIEYYDANSVDFRKKHDRRDECWFPESNRFAFVAIYDDKIVSECFSVFVDDGVAEVGIETDENFRRKGLAYLTAAAFIEHCSKNGLETNWGCWQHNPGSVALAEKLGYELVGEGVCVKVIVN